MKRFLTFVITCLLVFSLAACGSSSKTETSSAEQTNETSTLESVEEPSSETTQESEEPSSETTQEPSETSESSEEETSAPTESKELVVYFSWSGNTENVANEIANQTGADIFEIIPKTPYTDDYDAVVDLAQQEQSDNIRPEISDSIENIEDYDVIYVGFPNWWGDMPMILYTFFDSYDLSGKTVAPFCTSGGSGLSNTVAEIKALEPEATITDGLHIGSGSSDNPADAVTEWLVAIR